MCCVAGFCVVVAVFVLCRVGCCVVRMFVPCVACCWCRVALYCVALLVVVVYVRIVTCRVELCCLWSVVDIRAVSLCFELLCFVM